MENQDQIKEILANAKYPFYRRTVCHVFKVTSSDHCTTASLFEGNERITEDHAGIAFIPTSEESTQLEYELAFKKVLDVLKSK